MLRHVTLSFVVLSLLVALVGRLPAADRSEIPEKYTWNLADICPSVDAWKASREKLVARLPDMERFKGHLGDSAEMLFRGLSTLMDLDRELSRLYAYAFMRSDEDLRDAKRMGLRQSIEQVGVRFSAAVSFVRPEILTLDSATIASYISAEPRLKEYTTYLDDILRWKPHTLKPAEEQIVALAGNMAGAGSKVHTILTGAELPYPEVTLVSGETVRLDAPGYSRYRANGERGDRMKVFKAFWDNYQKFKGTFGTTLYERVKAHIFEKDVRKFDSCLDAALFSSNIPPSVYRQLIADVHSHLPTLHRYLRLRKRLLGVERLGYEDLYASIVKKVNLEFTTEEAETLTLAAVTPLGKPYVDTMRRGYRERWVDFLPSTGKRPGAYSTGVYGVHPYQLQNFMGRYEDVSTVAHEFGHSMHTYLASTTQPYVTHDYSIFVAEVASTLNEHLLFHHMLDATQDDATRLYLMGNYLEGARQTVYRQTLFAEFELKIHERAEKGEPLTGELLSEIYLDLLRTYYGHDAGVCHIDERYGMEWAYVHHFYYNFYVYQYSTSYVASSAIASRIRKEAEAGTTKTARDAYLGMLASGSSKYPIELLRDAGVDMTTSQPFTAGIVELNRILDEMEAIVARQKKRS